MTVEIEPSDLQDPKNVGLDSWSVTSMTPKLMEIKITFEYPLLISYERSDSIIITLADKNLFLSENDIRIP